MLPIILFLDDSEPRHKAFKQLVQAWGYLAKFEIKASRHGGICKEVDERFTTQTCSECGAKSPSSPKGIAGLGIREWVCSECGANHDRDVNSAQNILNLGLSALSKRQLVDLAKIRHQPPGEESCVNSLGR
jgi:transposase